MKNVRIFWEDLKKQDFNLAADIAVFLVMVLVIAPVPCYLLIPHILTNSGTNALSLTICFMIIMGTFIISNFLCRNMTYTHHDALVKDDIPHSTYAANS